MNKIKSDKWLNKNNENVKFDRFTKYYCEISNLSFKTHRPLRILLLT